MNKPIHFVVLAAPRTGSNWLCTLLDSHPEVLCHHEIFNPAGIHLARSRREQLVLGSLAERDNDPAAFIERIWKHSGNAAAVGFKLNRGQSPAAFSAIFADPDIRAIVLRRRNRLRTLLSERLAQATGEWESYEELPQKQEPLRLELTATELFAHAAANEAYFSELDARLAASGQARCDLVYEDLPLPETRRGLLEFLGVADLPLRGTTHRQGVRDLRDVILSFDRLAAELAATPFARELVSTEFTDFEQGAQK